MEGYGKALLQYVYDYKYEEIRLEPTESPGSGERKMNPGTSEQKNTKRTRPAQDIKIYPNPASSRLAVDMGNNISEVQLHIVDIAGKLLLDQSCKGNCLIDISGLQNGLYL